MEITSENEGLLRSGYEARTEKELPVLNRWFPKESVGDTGEAKYLDVILYSREQIRIEVGRGANETPLSYNITYRVVRLYVRVL